MKTTKQDLIDRANRLERENEPLSLALHDLVSDRTVWFGRNPFRVGISRPAGGAGGIVIVSSDGMTSAHYWETFHREEMARIQTLVTGTNTEENRALLRRREVLEQAQAHVRREQHGIAS